MDKTIKQLIKETHSNGIKDIVWNEAIQKWEVRYIGRGLKPIYYETFLELVQAIQPEEGH